MKTTGRPDPDAGPEVVRISAKDSLAINVNDVISSRDTSGNVITPLAGTITISVGTVTEIDQAQQIFPRVDTPVAESQVPSTVECAEREQDLLAGFIWLLPKSIREPFLGDLREDCERMAVEGRSPSFIRVAAACQCMLLFLGQGWNLLRKLSPFLLSWVMNRCS